ncbi:MAG TPA: hypothetical protein VJ302_36475 [Blastocatellia bacterium]|nr:hypothetical protein [Blastocatellia bacterium]
MKKNPNISDDANTGSEPESPASKAPPQSLAPGITLPPVAQVKLTRASGLPAPGDLSEDAIFWTAIRNRTEAISFDNYSKLIDRVLCEKTDEELKGACQDKSDLAELGSPSIKERREDLTRDFPSIYGVDVYNLLKLATQAFLLFETGIVIKEPRLGPDNQNNPAPDSFLREEQHRRGDSTIDYATLSGDLQKFLDVSGGKAPYLERIVDALVANGAARKQRSPFCEGHLLRRRFSCPSMIELIWSYWNEEGMLVQTMNAIALRFQNKRGPTERDPLANLEIDPLRPLNNLIWGFIQDEYNRLTVARRAYEYDHHYGLKIYGKAVPDLRSADSRSKFLEGFHNLLYRASLFYREDADTTVIADGFPLLNALREVHLLLAEGASNQFGDLPWTARAEMLTMQWLLARPEMREFLRGRAMVPYNERWMGQVDTMKRMQGWTDTSITHFRNLATYGEPLLLSVRYGDWIDVNDQEQAKTWARYWRPEIQGYIHAYLAVTGVDLSEDLVDTRRAAMRYVQPSLLLRRRLNGQGSAASLLPASAGAQPDAAEVNFSATAGFRRRRLNPGRKA